jgi:hypothetical protein
VAFYRDGDGAVWVDAGDERLACIIDPHYRAEDTDGASVGEPFRAVQVAAAWGPLVEVRPTGWETV